MYGQVVLYACMYACVYACMYVWMDGWMDRRMDGWMDVWMKTIYIYGVKWLQMTQVRQSHPLQTYMPSRCHQVPRMPRETKVDRWMSPSATPAT